MPTLVYDLPPGTLIDGRYKLLKALGQGGFGITYIAWDNELQRNVAVKECFPVGICLREQEGGAVRPIRSEWEDMYLHALDDMRKEARTLATLNHANIVRIHDVIWGNGSVFCVMPWLASGSLKQRLAEGPPGEEESMQWLRQLLAALDYLHSRGIFHRDLKPDNIMFDEQGAPVIIDFGAALNRPELTTTTTQGSFSRGYAAPEQITGKGHVGPWTDLYALSATWYELLTGCVPEASDARLMEDDMEPLTADKCRLRYPAELLALLQRNLSLKPAERCQSVSQCLECWRKGTLPPLQIPRHGRLKRLALTSAVLVVLGAGAGYMAWRALPVGGGTPAAADASPSEVKAQMTDKIRALCKVGEFAALCDTYRGRLQKLGTRWSERYRRLFRRTSEKLATRHTAEEIRALDSEFQDAYIQLFTEQSSDVAACMDDYQKAALKYLLTSVDISSRYEPQNLTEYSLLESVSSAVEQELRYAYDDVIIRCSDLMSQMPPELKQEYQNLLDEINRCRDAAP